MGLQIDVGDGSAAAQDMVPLAVNVGIDTVNVANLAVSPATLNVFNAGIDGAAATVAPGANLNVITPAFLQSQGGPCTVKLTGGIYGP